MSRRKRSGNSEKCKLLRSVASDAESESSEVRTAAIPRPLSDIVADVRSEWQAEMAALQHDDEGMTTAELSREFGIPVRTIQEIVASGVASGKYVCGRATRVDASGKRQRVNVYRVANPTNRE